MAISNLAKQAENIEGRISDAFVSRDGGSTYHSLGILQSVSVSFDPVTQEADVAGREKVIAVDVSVEVVMEQTADNEFGAVADLVQPTGKGDNVKLTKIPTAVADAGTADGYELINTFVAASGEINGNGEGSMFTVTAGGRVPVDEISDPSTIKFDV